MVDQQSAYLNATAAMGFPSFTRSVPRGGIFRFWYFGESENNLEKRYPRLRKEEGLSVSKRAGPSANDRLRTDPTDLIYT